MINRLLDVFASFQKHGVRYVVIGGIAAVLHGLLPVPFDLKYLDLWKRFSGAAD